MANKLTPEDLYSKLYRIAQSIIKRENPCQIREENGAVTCRHTRYKYGYKTPDGKPEPTLCCGGCRNLSATGCTTDSLWCKTWTCGSLQREVPDVAEALRILESVSHRVGVPLFFRTGKDESFARLL